LLTAAGVTGMDVLPRQRPDNAAVVLQQSINSLGIAALLVPDKLSGQLTLNGMFLAAGIHILHHGDEITRKDFRVWAAINDCVSETNYDPNIHGERVFCARTRNPLIAGQPIIICCGTPSNACGKIYSRSAWMDLKCPHCGFDPNQTGWTPPQKKRGDIDELRKFAER
jgi:hypothetical protein